MFAVAKASPAGIALVFPKRNKVDFGIFGVCRLMISLKMMHMYISFPK